MKNTEQKIYIRPKAFEALKLRSHGYELKSVGDMLSISSVTVAKYVNETLEKLELAMSTNSRIYRGKF